MAGRVVVFSPHPDDAELGMGGTIAGLSAAGVEVVVVDLTNGEPTPYGTVEIRAREAERATTILNLHHRSTLAIPNRGIFDTVDNREVVATEIRRWRPEVIFAPYWEDAHPDHVEASKLVDSARFYAKFVKTPMPFEPHTVKRTFYFFSTHLRVKFQPSFVTDISRHLETKIAALSAFESQFAVNPASRGVYDRVRGEAAYWGIQAGVEAGEPFVCRETVRVAADATMLAL